MEKSVLLLLASFCVSFMNSIIDGDDLADFRYSPSNSLFNSSLHGHMTHITGLTGTLEFDCDYCFTDIYQCYITSVCFQIRPYALECFFYTYSDAFHRGEGKDTRKALIFKCSEISDLTGFGAF